LVAQRRERHDANSTSVDVSRFHKTAEGQEQASEASPTSETAAKRLSSTVTLLNIVKGGSLEITRWCMTIIWNP
jgi:hypothetical protein